MTLKMILALVAVAQWIESWLANQKVTGSIPSQGSHLDCRPGPQVGRCERQLIDVSLSHDVSLLSFPSP